VTSADETTPFTLPVAVERVPLTMVGETLAQACVHDEQGAEVTRGLKAADLAELAKPSPKVRWVRIEGLADRVLMQAAADSFNLHPLAFEDVVHHASRPKLESYDNGYFLVMPRFSFAKRLRVEPVAIFLGEGWVLSFSQSKVMEFDTLEARLAAGRGGVRKGGADRLLHHVVDGIIDAYIPVLTSMDDSFARLESRLQGHRPDAVVYGLRELRADLFKMHTMLRALQAALSALHMDRDDWLDNAVQPYIKDLMDHVSQSIDHVENLREGVAEAQQLYHAILSQRINDVMRVLTIMSVIFMPLSFIAGVYGMNFQHMPELTWYWGYPLALIIMLFVASALMLFFARKGWLGRQDPPAIRDRMKNEEAP